MLLTTQAALAKGIASPITKIIYIYTYANLAIIKIANKTTNGHGCTYSKSDEFLLVNFDDASGKEMYSAALAAFMSNSKVRLAHNGCQKWWSSDTMPKVYRVDILK